MVCGWPRESSPHEGRCCCERTLLWEDSLTREKLTRLQEPLSSFARKMCGMKGVELEDAELLEVEMVAWRKAALESLWVLLEDADAGRWLEQAASATGEHKEQTG